VEPVVPVCEIEPVTDPPLLDELPPPHPAREVQAMRTRAADERNNRVMGYAFHTLRCERGGSFIGISSAAQLSPGCDLRHNLA